MEHSIDWCLREVRGIRVKYRLSDLGHEFLEQAPAINSIFNLVVLVDELDLKTSPPIDTLRVSCEECILKDIVTSCLDVGVHSIVVAVVNFGLHLVHEEGEDFCPHHELVHLWDFDDAGHAHALLDLSKCQILTLIL